MFNLQIENLQPSKSMVVMAKAKKMQATDPDVIDLSGGEPDFDTPQKIRDALKCWIDNGYTHYTVGAGLPELRTRIARKLQEENHCHYTPEQVIVTPGGKFAIYLAVRALVNAGEEVMYLNPAWVSYGSIIESSGGVPVGVDLAYDDEYAITEQALEAAVTDNTKLLIINYPNNPTGKLLTPNDRDALTAFMHKHPQVFVLSDEIYERIVFDGQENISLASDKTLSERIITVNGFSKSVAMTGWRIGYLAAGTEVVKRAFKLYQHTVTCVSGFMQKACVVALDCQEEIESMRVSYENRRDKFIGALNAIDGVECKLPNGAFYAWARFEVGDMSSETLCEYLLDNAKVACIPGISYGETGCTCVRFSFATSEEALLQGAKNIAVAMAQLRRERESI
ncbi:pyridoxal phosphate-dependent aminotransferase [Bengtsoniella intestinalis]|uniref:pyridoxal phosphate-dependent aminotransferase n=1 Tax=Bengtsoniella intestinalis TaxID=3073143 RepID=UPI00391FBAF5